MTASAHLSYCEFRGPIQRRAAICLALAFLCCLPATLCCSPKTLLANDAVPGLVPDRPESGRFVETDQGFMVPYTAKLPGTDVTFEMIPVPGGSYLMGSDAQEEGRNDDEGPPREIGIKPFWIAKHEVTWSEYRHFMKLYNLFKDFESSSIRPVNNTNKVDAITAPTPLYDPSFTFVLGEEPRMPAVTMSHYAARQYSKWLSGMSQLFYRLPTEAEWEYACRAGTKTAYSFGNNADQIGDYAWYYDNADDMYHNVGEKKPNAWGLHDMHGNVAEIVIDQYQPDAYRKKPGKQSSEDSIVWTDKMFSHVVRGGSWLADPPETRSAARSQTDDWRDEDPNLPKSPWWFTDEPALAVGFRLVRPLDAPKSKEERGKYWDIDNETLRLAVEDRLAEGRGAYGVVDAELADILDQKKDQ